MAPRDAQLFSIPRFPREPLTIAVRLATRAFVPITSTIYPSARTCSARTRTRTRRAHQPGRLETSQRTSGVATANCASGLCLREVRTSRHEARSRTGKPNTDSARSIFPNGERATRTIFFRQSDFGEWNLAYCRAGYPREIRVELYRRLEDPRPK